MHLPSWQGSNYDFELLPKLDPGLDSAITLSEKSSSSWHMQTDVRVAGRSYGLLSPLRECQSHRQLGQKGVEPSKSGTATFSLDRQRKRQCCRASQRGVERYVVPPDNKFEVDEELWGALDICSNEELEEIHKILFGKATVGYYVTKHQRMPKVQMYPVYTGNEINKVPNGAPVELFSGSIKGDSIDFKSS